MHLHVMKETSRLQLLRQTVQWRIQRDTYHLVTNDWFWPIFFFLCETSTWHLDSCPSEDTWYGVILWVLRVLGYFSPEFSLVVTSYWRAPKRAKQLSMATIPLCFEFFRCRVDVLQSQFSRSTISTAVFCLQNLICLLFIFADQVFIDPTFFGIFVCGPLQSFVVNV